MTIMDELDERLISLLRHNGRRSISDLALDLDVSRATVRARIERLERDKVIIGYTVVLRADAVDMPVRGITSIQIEGRATRQVIHTLEGIPEVSAIHTTNGRWDLVVELGSATLTDLDQVLQRLRQLPGVVASETSLLLATPYSTRARL